MSGSFSDDAFSLEALRAAPSSDLLEPGDLDDLHYALRVQGWYERGRLLRDLEERLLAGEDISPQLDDLFSRSSGAGSS